jgi:hypothetical protein
MSTARNWPPAADTVIVDPQTGLPVLTHEAAASCRGDCKQGRTPCTSQMLCRVITHTHRAWVLATHPSDDDLRRLTPDEWAREDARWICGLIAVIAALIVALFAWVTLVAGLPVMPS